MKMIKKSIYILLFAAIAFASCDKNEVVIDNSNNRVPGAQSPDFITFRNSILPSDSSWTVKGWAVDTISGFDDKFSIKPIATNAIIEISKTTDTTTINTLEFYLKGKNDWVNLYIDGEKKGEYKADIAWKKFNIYLPGGNHIIKWDCNTLNVNMDAIKFSKQKFVAGMPYQGGIIAFVTTTGHGIITAVKDTINQAYWYPDNLYVSTLFVGATGAGIGYGSMNTANIVGLYGNANYAAKLCDDFISNGYDDWYLPSKDELNEICVNRYAIGGFNYKYPYWSSTVEAGGKVWYQNFGNGLQQNVMNYGYAVRAARSF